MLITLELRMPRPGRDGCGAVFVSQTSCVGGLLFSTVPANELGTAGLTNTLHVTGLTCDVSRGEVPGRLVIFTFFPCFTLDLRHADRHGRGRSQQSDPVHPESCLGSVGQFSSPTEDAFRRDAKKGLQICARTEPFRRDAKHKLELTQYCQK